MRGRESGVFSARGRRHREVLMTTAGDIMHRECQWIPPTMNWTAAAKMMREINVGALPSE